MFVTSASRAYNISGYVDAVQPVTITVNHVFFCVTSVLLTSNNRGWYLLVARSN